MKPVSRKIESQCSDAYVHFLKTIKDNVSAKVFKTIHSKVERTTFGHVKNHIVGDIRDSLPIE